ncbi:MAG: glycosyltransferase family 4 protein [Rhodoferax sp.]|nr:glycosyltransferase family 4 protein [Rhodoferax sp.]MDP3650231.1 glycosyltransferase family 4 protein [Rhodoferax sp.]
MKILLLAPFPYGTASGQGGATVCFKALKALAAQHEVHVLCFSTGSENDHAAVIEMGKYAKSVQNVLLRVSKWKVFQAKLRSVFMPTPEHAIYFESGEFENALKQSLHFIAPALAMTQFPQMAQYLALCRGITTVHDVQDAFSVSWYRRAQTAPKGARRWYALKQWRNWVHYECLHYPLATQCWTLSEQDRYGLTAFAPRLSAISMGLPLTDQFAAAKSTSNGKVGFIASFGHPPNLEAMEFLMHHIAPLVYARLPHVEFLIAGREPPQGWVQAAPANIKFIGYVASLQNFYDSCDLIIAPLMSGGGVKIKVAEALCFGKALVTTPVGAEGIPIENGVHCLVEGDPTRFADAVCKLMASAPERDRLATAGVAMASQVFATSAWANRANRQLHRLAECQALGASHD